MLTQSRRRLLKTIATVGVSTVLTAGLALTAFADSSIGTNISTSSGGTITSAGLLTGSLGLTVTGAAVSLNASSNFATNIGTGTTTSAVTLGGGANAIALNGTTVTLTANTAGNDITANVVDNNTDALDIQQGTDNYINLDTTNTTEALAFGNATTNPSFSFLGSGNLTVAGADIIGAGSESIDISEATANAFTFTRNDVGAVTLTSADNDADADLVVGAGGTGALTVGDTGSTSLLTGTTITLTTSGATSDITANVVDNNTDALDVQEGANDYINLNTTNSSEALAFGNATTNPSFSFLGTGTLTFGGLTRRTVTAAITAGATQTQAGATALTTDINNVATVTTTDDGVKLPAGAIGLDIVVINRGANTLKLYPAVGGTINALAQDGAYSVATLVEVRCTFITATSIECQKTAR